MAGPKLCEQAPDDDDASLFCQRSVAASSVMMRKGAGASSRRRLSLSSSTMSVSTVGWSRWARQQDDRVHGLFEQLVWRLLLPPGGDQQQQPQAVEGGAGAPERPAGNINVAVGDDEDDGGCLRAEDLSLEVAAAMAKVKGHRFLDVEENKVKQRLQGIAEKFMFHGRSREKQRLLDLGQKLVTQKKAGLTKPYAVMSLLLELSYRPLERPLAARQVGKQGEDEDEEGLLRKGRREGASAQQEEEGDQEGEASVRAIDRAWRQELLAASDEDEDDEGIEEEEEEEEEARGGTTAATAASAPSRHMAGEERHDHLGGGVHAMRPVCGGHVSTSFIGQHKGSSSRRERDYHDRHYGKSSLSVLTPLGVAPVATDGGSACGGRDDDGRLGGRHPCLLTHAYAAHLLSRRRAGDGDEDGSMRLQPRFRYVSEAELVRLSLQALGGSASPPLFVRPSPRHEYYQLGDAVRGVLACPHLSPGSLQSLLSRLLCHVNCLGFLREFAATAINNATATTTSEIGAKRRRRRSRVFEALGQSVGRWVEVVEGELSSRETGLDKALKGRTGEEGVVTTLLGVLAERGLRRRWEEGRALANMVREAIREEDDDEGEEGEGGQGACSSSRSRRIRTGRVLSRLYEVCEREALADGAQGRLLSRVFLEALEPYRAMVLNDWAKGGGAAGGGKEDVWGEFMAVGKGVEALMIEEAVPRFLRGGGGGGHVAAAAAAAATDGGSGSMMMETLSEDVATIRAAEQHQGQQQPEVTTPTSLSLIVAPRSDQDEGDDGLGGGTGETVTGSSSTLMTSLFTADPWGTTAITPSTSMAVVARAPISPPPEQEENEDDIVDNGDSWTWLSRELSSRLLNPLRSRCLQVRSRCMAHFLAIPPSSSSTLQLHAYLSGLARLFLLAGDRTLLPVWRDRVFPALAAGKRPSGATVEAWLHHAIHQQQQDEGGSSTSKRASSTTNWVFLEPFRPSLTQQDDEDEGEEDQEGAQSPREGYSGRRRRRKWCQRRHGTGPALEAISVTLDSYRHGGGGGGDDDDDDDDDDEGEEGGRQSIDGQGGNDDAVSYLHGLTLSWRFPWPLNRVVTVEHLSGYSRLLRLPLQVLYVRYRLERLCRERTKWTSRLSAALYVVAAVDEHLGLQLQGAALLEDLVKQMYTATSVSGLCELHGRYVSSLEERALLLPATRSLLSHLICLLQRVDKLCDVAGGGARNGTKAVRRAQEDEQQQEKREVACYRAVVEELASVNALLAHLVKARLAPWVEALYLRLNYNGFFESSRGGAL